MKIISFYTGKYEWDARELIKTLDGFGVEYDVEYRNSLGTWSSNTQIKGEFILSKLKENDSVVWTDADSRLKQYPELFDSIDTDLGLFFLPKEKSFKYSPPAWSVLDNDTVVRHGGFLQSGTMYFKNTPTVISLLEKWVEMNSHDSRQWDQWTLQKCLNEFKDLTITKLPPEYVWIDSISVHQYGTVSPVIYHTQASRRFKEKNV